MTIRNRATAAASPPAPKHHAGEDIVGACRQLHTAIDRLDELAASMAGISRSDLRCLNLLEHGPLPATVIARQLNLATGSVTALIDRLESKALVTRLREEGDRRVVRVQATAKVFELIGPVYLGFANRLRLLVMGYPAADRELAVQHLLDVAGACELAIADRR
jgi:DNA-binding MarR family transcriptional regulator